MWCGVNIRFELVDWNVQNTWGQCNHNPCTDLESTWLLKGTAVKKRNTGGWTYHAFIPSGWGSRVRNPWALNHDTCTCTSASKTRPTTSMLTRLPSRRPSFGIIHVNWWRQQSKFSLVSTIFTNYTKFMFTYSTPGMKRHWISLWLLSNIVSFLTTKCTKTTSLD